MDNGTPAYKYDEEGYPVLTGWRYWLYFDDKGNLMPMNEKHCELNRFSNEYYVFTFDFIPLSDLNANVLSLPKYMYRTVYKGKLWFRPLKMDLKEFRLTAERITKSRIPSDEYCNISISEVTHE